MIKKVESLIKEFYIWEIDQKDRFNSQLSFPATVLTIMFGVLFIIVQNLPSQVSTTIGVVFFVLLGMTTIAVIVFVGFLIRSTLGYDYEYLPDSESIREYIIGLESYYKKTQNNNDGRETSSLIENDISEYLIEYCSSAAKRNRQNNIKKGKHLHNAKIAMTVSLVLMLLTFVFYGMIKSKEKKITEVHIVNMENKGDKVTDTNDTANETRDLISGQDQASDHPKSDVGKSDTSPIPENDAKKPEPPQNVSGKFTKEGVDRENVKRYNK